MSASPRKKQEVRLERNRVKPFHKPGTLGWNQDHHLSTKAIQQSSENVLHTIKIEGKK